jgi:hypothetical protein
VALKFPYWIMPALCQPDLVIWLEAVSVVFLKGIIEIALDWRVFSQFHQVLILTAALRV